MFWDDDLILSLVTAFIVSSLAGFWFGDRVRRWLRKASQSKEQRMSRILIVDDDPVIRECLREMLESHGHAVIEAGTMVEATAILKSGSVEAVIADGSLPKDRLEARLNAWGPVLTAEARIRRMRTLLYSGEEELVELERRGGNPALLKPASMAEILAALEDKSEAKR